MKRQQVGFQSQPVGFERRDAAAGHVAFGHPPFLFLERPIQVRPNTRQLVLKFTRVNRCQNLVGAYDVAGPHVGRLQRSVKRHGDVATFHRLQLHVGSDAITNGNAHQRDGQGDCQENEIAAGASDRR